MINRLLFFLKYYLFWIVIFLFFKILFILYHLDKFETSNFFDYAGILWHGLKMDVSMASYIMFVPALVFVVLSAFKNALEYPIIFGFTIFVLVIVSLLHIVDMELYNYWRFRLDEEFLSYLNSPKEMLANLAWYHFLLLIALTAGLYFLFINLLYKRVLKLSRDCCITHSWKNVPVFLVLAAALLIPVRGGLGTAPLNTGTAYFHSEEMMNHSTINPVWSLIYSYTEKDKLSYKVDFFDENKEKELLYNLFVARGDSSQRVLNTSRPNVILVILESFSSNLLKEVSGLDGVTPNLSKFIKEGLYFNNFYANGSNSKSGLGAILSGYPALPTTCIIQYEKKSQTLPGISKDLKKMGYQSKFLYGGDIDFAHFKSFLINNKFDTIISDKDFPNSDYMAKWGVPDHIVFKRLLKECNRSTQPFFNTYFTLSSHEPYEVPMETVIEGNSKEKKFMNSVYYTDQALGNFIEEAKKQSWWDNTLVILVADHGSRVEDMTQYDYRRYHIPMIWLGGAIKNKGTEISKYGSQVDISKTLLGQLEINTDNYLFSKDLLDSTTSSFAQYTIRNGVGYISEDTYAVLDLTNNDFLVNKAKNKENDENILKAYTQWLLKDFLNR